MIAAEVLHVATCVIPWMDSSIMWIAPNYEKTNIPQMYRVGIIYHECRHTEVNNNNWSHATCPTPYLDDNGNDIVGIISGAKMEGKAACDSHVLRRLRFSKPYF